MPLVAEYISLLRSDGYGLRSLMSTSTVRFAASHLRLRGTIVQTVRRLLCLHACCGSSMILAGHHISNGDNIVLRSSYRYR